MSYETATWIQGSFGVAIALFAAIAFLHGMAFPEQYKPVKIPEYIDTGICMDRNDHSEELKQLRKQLAELKARQVHASNSKNKPKPKPKPKENTLIQDCISALEGLGEKKSVARATVNKYFTSNPDTKSVDEFIAGVFKR